MCVSLPRYTTSSGRKFKLISSVLKGLHFLSYILKNIEQKQPYVIADTIQLIILLWKTVGFLDFISISINPIYPLLTKLSDLYLHPLEVVSRYRDPQLQVGVNYSYLFSLRSKICKSLCSNTHFIYNSSDLIV